MFDFPLPFNSELRAKDLVPYQTNKKLVESIEYIFLHPTNKYNKLYHTYFNRDKYISRNMSNLAVACCREYLLNPAQYGNSLDNINLQILVRMHKKFLYHIKLHNEQLHEYMPLKLAILSIDNGFLDLLLETCNNKDYIQHHDELVKKREGIGLRERQVGYSKKELDYLSSLE